MSRIKKKTLKNFTFLNCALDWVNWEVGEPDDHNDENCVEAYDWPTAMKPTMTWNDEGCDHGRKWLCQAQR